MQARRDGAGVARSQLDEEVVRRDLRVVDGDVPEPGVEHARVGELVLRVERRSAPVLLDEVVIGECLLRVEVAPAHPGVRRRRVDVPPVFLGILAVIALRAGQAEDPLLEDGIDAVPECERDAEQLVLVAESAETVLAPPKRS